MLQDHDINGLGDALHAAWSKRTTIAPLSTTHAGLTLDDAYRIQTRMLSHRLAAGQAVVGKKIGVTSKAVQDMLDVRQPDFGVLLSGMLYEDGAAVPADTLIQPRAEGEVAFLMKRDLMGPGITAAQVLAATDCVMPCFEIVDSRITDWKIRIQDTVADNASCGVFVLGDRAVSPLAVDLETCGLVLEKNGEVVATGAGAAVQGSPLNAVAWLANTLGALGTPLRAGELVLSGSLAALIPVQRGDALRMSIGGLGNASVRFT